MADPVVTIVNGIPATGTGTITTLGQTLTDGANVSVGAIADAAVAAGAVGTLSAKLRAISRDVANIVLAAGANIIGKVGIDQTTPGTTNGVQVNAALPAGANIVGKVGIDQTTDGTTNLVAAKQSGTWTVQPGNTANTTAWKVDGSAVTQPISNASLTNALAGKYETVAASQTAQVLGGAGAIGDYLSGLLVTPTTVSPGVVTILDNAISINVFAGGTNALSNLAPFFIPIGFYSVSGAWKCTTGAGLSVAASGNFT